MNDSKATNTFIPRQASEPTPEHFGMLVGDGMERLAAAALDCGGDIPRGAVIHDNGCGLGAVTAAIVARVSPEVLASLKITASDILEPVITAYRAEATKGSWPAESHVADSNSLPFPDDTFTHSIGNALLFAGPDNDGKGVVKEAYRTLKPGGKLIVNSFKTLPNLGPLREASRATRAPGAPVPRDGTEKWADPEFLSGIVRTGGFTKDNVEMYEREVDITTCEFHRYCTLLWSFIGGSTEAGWTKEDEERWDEAVEVVKRELRKTEGFRMLDDGRAVVRFVANVAVAMK